MRGLSLVAASRGHSSSRCAGLSLSRPLPLRSTRSRRTGSVIVAHGPSCSAARGIFPDQGSNPCSLHWQADSQPLHHQGSPTPSFLTFDPYAVRLCRKPQAARDGGDPAIWSGVRKGGLSPEFCSPSPSVAPRDTEFKTYRPLDKCHAGLPTWRGKTSTGRATDRLSPPLPHPFTVN